MKDNHIKASMFLSERFIKDDPNFFVDFVIAGSLVENHSLTHALLTNLSYSEQVHEICAEADLQQQEFDRFKQRLVACVYVASLVENGGWV